MSRKIVTNYANRGDNIQTRIKKFVQKLEEAGNSKPKISSALNTEKRFLGLIGGKLRFALRTTQKYISMYKKAVASAFPPAIEFIELLYTSNEHDLDCLAEMKIVAAAYGSSYDLIQAFNRAKPALLKSNPDLLDLMLKTPISHPVYSRLSLKRSQTLTINTDKRAAVIAKKTTRIKISRLVVAKSVPVALASRALYKRMLGLMLCSGRRPIELLKTGSFEKSDVENHVLFSGQAKKKNGVVAKPYLIPILHVSVDDFLREFNDFRDSLPEYTHGLDNVAMGKKYTTEAAPAARDLLLSVDACCYTCRSIYAVQSFEKYGQIIDRDIYMSSILGHATNDLISVDSYQGIQMSDGSYESVRNEYRKELDDRKEQAALADQSREKQVSKRWDNLNKKTKKIEKLGRAAPRIHEFCLEEIACNPNVLLTQTLITRKLGCSRPAIKKYLDTIGTLATKAK